MAKAELRRRRAEARESGKLLQDKQALEGRLKEVQTVLENVQNQRNDLKQQFRVSVALDATPRISLHGQHHKGTGQAQGCSETGHQFEQQSPVCPGNEMAPFACHAGLMSAIYT